MSLLHDALLIFSELSSQCATIYSKVTIAYYFYKWNEVKQRCRSAALRCSRLKRMQNMDTLHRFFVVVITYQICKKRDRPKTSVTKYKRKIVALWK